MYKNKIIISATIAIALVFSGIQCLAASTGTINTETVKMRAKASTESNVITLVSQDEKVEIIEKSEDWYKVNYDGKTGYIYAKYVTAKEDTNSTESNTTEKEDEDAEICPLCNKEIITQTNKGEPAVSNRKAPSGKCYMEIARRILGENIDVTIPGRDEGIFSKIIGVFRRK